jgi:hypothetical protein
VFNALKEQCLKAIFFEIGEPASRHPKITTQMIEAGMIVGTHTWSQKGLARNAFAKDIESDEQEIELDNSAVHTAPAGAAIAHSSGFPICCRHDSSLNIWQGAISPSSRLISTRRPMHKSEQVINSNLKRAAEASSSYMIYNRNEALPGLLRHLKQGGYKVVDTLSTLQPFPNTTRCLKRDEKLSSNDNRPEEQCS